MSSRSSSRNTPNRNRKARRQSTLIGGTESFYQMLVETAGVAMWWSPHNSVDFTYLSPEAEKIFGYSLEECIQPGFREQLVHPEDRKWVIEYCQLATEEGHPHQLEYRILTKEGKLRTVRDIVRLTFKDGKPFAKVGVLIDISTHTLTVEELQASNEKFYRAFHNFPIPASISRLSDARLIDVNKNFLLTSGYERHQLVGRNVSELKGWMDVADRELIIQMLRNKEKVEKYPVILKDALGRHRNVLLSAELFENQGETCLLLMYYDVTEQIKTEERLQHINRELETFMYKSSHNLKGPVASIKGLVQLARKEKNEENKLKYLQLMERSVIGLENTLEELMDIARVKQGNLQIESIDLNAIVEEVNQKLKFMPEWQGIDYKVQIKQDGPFYTDGHLLYSILQNLIENSVKYKKEGKELLLNISAFIEGKEMRLIVEDNGIGIPPEQQERIFEMFYRAHSTASGTGLGLYIVRNAVDKLQGSIKVSSEPNKGSVFFITLPNLKPDIIKSPNMIS